MTQIMCGKKMTYHTAPKSLKKEDDHGADKEHALSAGSLA